MHPGSATTPLTDEARGDFAPYAAAIVRAAPVAGARHRRERAEPQPLLAPAVRARRDERRARRVSRAAGADVRRAQGRLAGRTASTAARSRRAGATTRRVAADSLADGVHPGAGHRLPRERPRPAGDGRLRHPSVRGQLEPAADDRASEHDDDRDRGLREARRAPRRGLRRTAQPGSELPILYGEFGVESQIPAAKAALYTGAEPAATRPVSESTQAAYYEQALALAFCQPTVEGMLLFLSRDERARAAWQSGVHYVDGTPKASKPRVTEALDRTTGGSITRCPGVELPSGRRTSASGLARRPSAASSGSVSAAISTAATGCASRTP